MSDGGFPDPDFILDPLAPDGQIRGDDLPHVEDLNLREKYIGAVSLLCRVYAAMGQERRTDFERDGDPMRELAEDFNRLPFESMSRNKALGDAGLHVIRAAAEGCAQIDRQRLRARIEESSRPSPGTSELLSRPMAQEVVGWGGKDVVMYDIVTGLSPVHLRGGRIDRELRGETLKGKLEKEGL